MIKNILRYYHEKTIKEKQLKEVLVSFQGKTSSLVALIDTGNSLIEPISKLPVFVVEYSAIENLLPKKLKDVYVNGKIDFILMEKLMVEIKDQINLSIIPFKSIGSHNSILLGFKPDYIWILNDSGAKKYENLLIGVFNHKLSIDEQYKGLLNLEILKGGELYVKES